MDATRTDPRTSLDPAAERRGARLAWALLLPTALLAWPGPGSFLRHDFAPQATGAGVAALALLPAAVLLLWPGRRATPRGLGFLLAPIAIAVLWFGADRVTDTFEASRAIVVLISASAAFLGGANAGQAGRTILVRGAVVLSIALTSCALFDGQRAYTGALGNTGSVSEAALAGAACGAVLVTGASRSWRVAGAVAVLAFLAYTTCVPVLAGSLSAALALGAWLVAARRARSSRVVAACGLGLAIVALVTPLVTPQAGSRPASPSDSAATAGPVTLDAGAGRTGGIAVRAWVWNSSLSMLADHPLAGVGPGQFRATFPAYRDPREIERSTHGRRLAEETEVEHPHNDVLLPWLEGGVLAGLAWSAFLVTLLLAAWRGLRAAPPEEVAVAAACVALSANAFVRAPLFSNPAASVLAFALFGSLLTRPPDEGARRARRFVLFGAGLLVLALAPRAWAFARHGLALQDLATPDQDGDVVQAAVSRAIEATPDSALARAESARIAEKRGDGAPVVAAEWDRVLALRPCSIEAWIQRGLVAVRAEDEAVARRSFERALELDPGHPVALRDLAVLELNHGRVAVGLAALDRIPATRAPDREWLATFAERLWLRGVDESAEALWARVDPALATAGPQASYDRAKSLRADGKTLSADAFEARAHRAWAREHADRGRFADAVRSYRQDLRLCSIHVQGGAPRVRLELAAALYSAEKPDEARLQLAGLEPSERDLEALPAWARERLRSAGALEKK